MRIELLHNRIIADCMTQKFALCFEENLVPMLAEIYPSLDGVLMYEDHLADRLMKDGEWHYPLTVFVDGVPEICWIKWKVDDSFKNACPYSFTGSGSIEFSIVEDLPRGFEEATLGRAISYPEGCIGVRVVGVKKDPTFLVGRYSQTFVDELARQISDELVRTLSVETVAGGTLELQIVFAHDTYMEHTSENVTYRRLLLTDKGCQPRDFWVKWTRLDSFVGYTMRDDISPDLIRFELGEDVPQKIREREYRFLCRSNPDKYQSAMGKKTVTEWRELIKRSIKRGDLVKVEGPVVEEPVLPPVEEPTAPPVAEVPAPAPTVATAPVCEEDDLDRRLKAILGEYAAATSEPVPEVDDSDIAMMARAALGIEEPAAEPADEDYVFGIDMPAEEVSEDESDEDEITDDELTEDEPLEDSEEGGDESEISEEDEADGLPWDDEPAEEVVEDEPTDGEETADAVTADEIAEDEPADEETAAQTPAAPSEDDIRREIEARIRREIEEEARAKAEAERERMRSEHDRLREENERLREEARLREEEKARRESARIEEEERRREEEERTRARIAEQARIEEAERARLAEIARVAVEEQKERERRDAEYRRQEEERLERERRAKEEEERRRAQPLYVTKHAKLIFRRPVDLSVLNRIKEIVESTIISEKKEHVHIYMKAYPIDSYTINLDMKLPDNEGDLLVTLVKAIGNGHLGITKIIVE